MLSAVVKKGRPIVGIALLLLGVDAYRGGVISPVMASASTPPVAEAGVAQVISRPVHVWRTFSGRLVAAEQVNIHPRVAGMIEAIHFKEGAIVNKGDLLLTLDQRPYLAEVNKAKGVLLALQAQTQLAETELHRATQLKMQKVISTSEYEIRKSNLRVLQANIKSAQAALENAKLNLSFTQVYAPISGKISRAERTAGNLVEPGIHNPPLTSIVALNPLYADFEIEEKTLLECLKGGMFTPGKVEQFTVLFGLGNELDITRPGKMVAFDNHFNFTTGTLRVRAQLDNTHQQLVPGLPVKIKLATAQQVPALLIADSAIGTDQSKKFVYVIDEENKIHYREVKLGPLVEGLRLIEEGLSGQEKIIVSGLQHVRPTQIIRPQRVAMLPEQVVG